MPYGSLELLLYDKGVYDQARAGATDQDFMDWQNNGRKYAANRGALTNNLEYGESLNPMYGNIMDVIAGRKTLKGNPPTINDMDYRRPGKKEENGYSGNNNYSTNMNYPSIAESMLTATGAPSTQRVKPGVKPLPQPVIGKPGKAVLPPAVAVPVTPAAPIAPNVGGGGGGGTGGGATGEAEGKSDAEKEATATGAEATSEGFFKKNWMSLLGVAIGGLGGFLYAKGAGKNLVGFTVGGAVVGGGVGFGVQYMMNKKDAAPAPAPAEGEKKFCCGG